MIREMEEVLGQVMWLSQNSHLQGAVWGGGKTASKFREISSFDRIDFSNLSP